MKIQLRIGSCIVGQFSFDAFGTEKHKKAMDRAMQRFLDLMGEDCVPEFSNFVKAVK